MSLVTLQDIFQLGYLEYECTHPLPAHVRKAVRAIMHGRTAGLGGHVQACPDGHVSRIWDNSCRHRSCPQCAFIHVARWLATQRARRLAGDHSHVICTLPHDLTPLWLGNVSLMTSLLFQTVHDTLLPLRAAPTGLGAQPGISGATSTRNSVPSAASAWCAPWSCRVGVSRHPPHRRSVPHEPRPYRDAASAWQGVVCPVAVPWGPANGGGRVWRRPGAGSGGGAAPPQGCLRVTRGGYRRLPPQQSP